MVASLLRPLLCLPVTQEVIVSPLGSWRARGSQGNPPEEPQGNPKGNPEGIHLLQAALAQYYKYLFLHRGLLVFYVVDADYLS